jgi:hypothetical protein
MLSIGMVAGFAGASGLPATGSDSIFGNPGICAEATPAASSKTRKQNGTIDAMQVVDGIFFTVPS